MGFNVKEKRAKLICRSAYILWGLLILWSPFLFAQNVSDTMSYITLAPDSVSAEGVSACTVTAFITDAAGTALSGKQVTIQSSRGGSVDTITQPASNTDTSGCASGYIRSSFAGTATITVLCDSKTVQCSPPGIFLRLVRPGISLSKTMRNIRTGETGASVSFNLGDTIEYTLLASNMGDETATDVRMNDTQVFDTGPAGQIVFAGMDTAPSDTWLYTLSWDPSDTDWIEGSPAEGAVNIKGLSWIFGYIEAAGSRQVKFRLKFK